MSFGEGNLREAVRDLDARNTALNIQLSDMRQRCEGLVSVARFMAAAMKEHGYETEAPACWGHVVRQLRKLGVEVER